MSTVWKQRSYFGLLYFLEGAPIGLIWWALPTFLSQRGLSVSDIAFVLSGATLPWALKFLAAPFFDRVESTRRHASFILFSQFAMLGAVIFLAIICQQAVLNLSQLHIGVVLMALIGALQDVGIDSLAVEIVPEGERGKINGFMQFGMLVARALWGGLPLWLSADNSLSLSLWIYAGIILFSTPLHRKVLKAQKIDRTKEPHFTEGLASLLRSRLFWIGVVVAIVGGAGFEPISSMAGPILTKAGLEKSLVGGFYLFLAVPMMSLGALFAGWASDRQPKHKSLIQSFLFLSVSVALFSYVANVATQGSAILFFAWILMYFGIGQYTASSYAFLMDIAAGFSMRATAFTGLMALTNLCESGSTFLFGVLFAPGRVFSVSILMVLLSCVGMAPLLFINRTRES